MLAHKGLLNNKSSSNWNRTSKKPHELYLLTKNSYRTKCKNQNI